MAQTEPASPISRYLAEIVKSLQKIVMEKRKMDSSEREGEAQSLGERPDLVGVAGGALPYLHDGAVGERVVGEVEALSCSGVSIVRKVEWEVNVPWFWSEIRSSPV